MIVKGDCSILSSHHPIASYLPKLLNQSPTGRFKDAFLVKTFSLIYRQRLTVDLLSVSSDSHSSELQDYSEILFIALNI